MSWPRLLRAASVAALALTVALTLAPAAAACGGLFCAVAITAPEPVDQNAERIIFVVNRDGTVTAHVQIQYAGSPERFAWVVPVPSVPGVADSSEDAFIDLDDLTRLTIVPPPTIPCAQANSNGGCVGGDSSASGASFAFDESAAEDDGVTVYDHGFTDSYEFHVVGAEDTAALVTWLQDNDYNVSDNMTPVMEVYNGADGKFLALKLQAGKTARDIAPIAMTIEGSFPMVPIRLTAVAAQPLMGILVYILADSPYRPALPYQVVDPTADDLLFDVDDSFNGSSNYFAWAARVADEEGGRAMVREFVGANPMEGWAYEGFSTDHTWVSRFYTRMSPHQMTYDPVFEPDPELTTFDGTVDFSGHPALIECGSVVEERRPTACSRIYCGQDADCAIEDGRAGCVCPEGRVAQGFRDPDGLSSVTCVPTVNDFGVTDEAAGVGTEFDPCGAYDCGDGTCVVKGGFPTCACDLGALACVEDQGGTADGDPGTILCVPSTTGQTFGPGAGLESAAYLPAQGAPAQAPPERTYAVPQWLPVLLVLLALAAVRRRRRALSP